MIKVIVHSKLIDRAERIIRSCYTEQQFHHAERYNYLVTQRVYPGWNKTQRGYDRSRWLRNHLACMVDHRRNAIQDLEKIHGSLV